MPKSVARIAYTRRGVVTSAYVLKKDHRNLRGRNDPRLQKSALGLIAKKVLWTCVIMERWIGCSGRTRQSRWRHRQVVVHHDVSVRCVGDTWLSEKCLDFKLLEAAGKGDHRARRGVLERVEAAVGQMGGGGCSVPRTRAQAKRPGSFLPWPNSTHLNLRLMVGKRTGQVKAEIRTQTV